MATQTITTPVDDIDGKEGDGVANQRFALDGTAYEIDLCGDHRAELAGIFEPYIKHGRRIGGKRAAKKGTAAVPAAIPEPLLIGKAGRAYRAKVRKWAVLSGWWADHGYAEPPERGQLPARLVADYQAAGEP